MAWEYEAQEAEGLKAVDRFKDGPGEPRVDARYKESYRKGYMSCLSRDIAHCKAYMRENDATEHEIRRCQTVQDFISWISGEMD